MNLEADETQRHGTAPTVRSFLCGCSPLQIWLKHRVCFFTGWPHSLTKPRTWLRAAYDWHLILTVMTVPSETGTGGMAPGRGVAGKVASTAGRHAGRRREAVRAAGRAGSGNIAASWSPSLLRALRRRTITQGPRPDVKTIRFVPQANSNKTGSCSVARFGASSQQVSSEVSKSTGETFLLPRTTSVRQGREHGLLAVR